jgi:pimeloyl-ACP methyl ester carboxylesterase
MNAFPIGYRDFHPDPSMNFELNRWLSALPEDDVAALARRVETLSDWTRVMGAEADRAEAEGRLLNAAFYCRAAEFFLEPGHADKAALYDRFVALFDAAVPEAAACRTSVPYAGAALPAMVVPARGEEKEIVLLHGGFDSFQEELWDWARWLADAGYRVVLFDGPGQGAALRRSGLTMTPAWERPVAAVLDHLGIAACTILGVSLGGYLAPRAAAFEPRIRRVIACDVLDDFFDCFAARGGPALAGLLAALLAGGLRKALNKLIGRALRRDPHVSWALRHGMQVSGAGDPFEFVGWLRAMRTAGFSERITQDFLLLAGAEDHIVPLRQFWRQGQNLPNARSFTGRVFTRAEAAHNHCHIGNVGLALAFIRSWLDFQVSAEQAGMLPARGAK